MYLYHCYEASCSLRTDYELTAAADELQDTKYSSAGMLPVTFGIAQDGR